MKLTITASWEFDADDSVNISQHVKDLLDQDPAFMPRSIDLYLEKDDDDA